MNDRKHVIFMVLKIQMRFLNGGTKLLLRVCVCHERYFHRFRRMINNNIIMRCVDRRKVFSRRIIITIGNLYF